MKKLIVLGIILFATSVMASPFLVSDPNPGVTFYKVTNVNDGVIDSITCAPEPDGSLKTDVAGVRAGVNNVTVAACASNPLWGEACSADVNFTFTRPAPPAITSNIRLLP
jgi:hypothetical protein